MPIMRIVVYSHTTLSKRRRRTSSSQKVRRSPKREEIERKMSQTTVQRKMRRMKSMWPLKLVEVRCFGSAASNLRNASCRDSAHHSRADVGGFLKRLIAALLKNVGRE